MKIANRETFLKMPKNTVFSKYEPDVFSELQIKCDTWPDSGDFLYCPIQDSADRAVSGAYLESYEVDLETQQRDGLFDEGQLFAVWEKRDVEKLIKRLRQCL